VGGLGGDGGQGLQEPRRQPGGGVRDGGGPEGPAGRERPPDLRQKLTGDRSATGPAPPGRCPVATKTLPSTRSITGMPSGNSGRAPTHGSPIWVARSSRPSSSYDSRR